MYALKKIFQKRYSGMLEENIIEKEVSKEMIQIEICQRKILPHLLTIEAERAATEPPPGEGDLAPTVRMKSLTSIVASGPSRSSRVMYLENTQGYDIRITVNKFSVILDSF